MLTIAGVPLPLPTREVLEWIERNIPLELYTPWLWRSWPGFGLAGITWPTGYQQQRGVKLNRLYWPNGACRWAFGQFYADAQTASAVRDAAFGQDGTSEAPVTLVMNSPGTPNDETVTTNLFLFPPYPVSGVPVDTANHSVNNAYILTVVDQRYFWWFVQTPTLAYDDDTTWTTAFKTVSDALDITINLDTIASEYLNVSPSMNLSYEVIPPFFDALAYNVGQRVAVTLDGQVYSQNFDSAEQDIETDEINNPRRVIRAGGSRFLDNIY